MTPLLLSVHLHTLLHTHIHLLLGTFREVIVIHSEYDATEITTQLVNFCSLVALQCKMSKIEIEKGDVAGVCCVGCGITTVITYIIGTCLSWVYAKAIFPESEVAAAAAIIITLSAFTIIGSLIFASIFRFKEAAKCGEYLSITTVSLSTLFDVIGVILLIVSMVQAARDLESPAGTIVGGALATFFVFLSAISNCCTIAGMEISTRGNN